MATVEFEVLGDTVLCIIPIVLVAFRTFVFKASFAVLLYIVAVANELYVLNARAFFEVGTSMLETIEICTFPVLVLVTTSLVDATNLFVLSVTLKRERPVNNDN